MKIKYIPIAERITLVLLSALLFTGLLVVRAQRNRDVEKLVIQKGAFTEEISLWEVEAMLIEKRRFDINSACRDELMTIPGIGPHLAGVLVDYRLEHGDFYGPEDILAVKGIGPSTLRRIERYVHYGKKRP